MFSASAFLWKWNKVSPANDGIILMPSFWCDDAIILMPSFWCHHFDASFWCHHFDAIILTNDGIILMASFGMLKPSFWSVQFFIRSDLMRFPQVKSIESIVALATSDGEIKQRRSNVSFAGVLRYPVVNLDRNYIFVANLWILGRRLLFPIASLGSYPGAFGGQGTTVPFRENVVLPRVCKPFHSSKPDLGGVNS